MKGHKGYHHGRKGRAGGGVNECEENEKMKPERYNNSKVESEAEEKKRGGGVKHLGKVDGEKVKSRGDRKPRKSGGRATGGNCEATPFSSARSGEGTKGHKTEKSE